MISRFFRIHLALPAFVGLLLCATTAQAQFFKQASSSPIAVGSQPSYTAVGDFNNDGSPDLVSSNSGSGTLTVLLGDGSGGFSQAAGSPIAVGVSPQGVAVGDFNLDGKLDIVVLNQGNNTATVLLGNGAGAFSPAAGSPFASDLFPQNVVVGDFNGDHKPDIAVTNYSSNTVAIYLGAGNGQFSARTTFATGLHPSGLAVADFNHDGRLDLATANFDANTVTVLLGDGLGGFSAAPGSGFSSGGTTPDQLVFGDFNGDGKPDLAVGNRSSNKVGIFLGNGNGSFTAGTPVTTGSDPTSIGTADLDGDGKLDLAVSNGIDGKVSVFHGSGTGTFAEVPGSPFTVTANPRGISIADFNNDGRPDVATADYNSSKVSVLQNNLLRKTFIPKSATFYAPVGTTADQSLAFATFCGCIGVKSVDQPWMSVSPSGALVVNPSGLAAGAYTGNLRDFNQAAVFDPTQDYFGGVLPVTFNVANPASGFTAAAGGPFASGTQPRAVAKGDFNGDGNLDLAIVNEGDNNVRILLANGSGGFTPSGTFSVGSTPGGVAVGDFDRDGKLDLAVTNNGGSTVTILLGDGSGSFSQVTGPFPAGTAPNAIAAGDFNNDGIPDLAVAGTGGLTLLIGDGFGAFYTAAGSPFPLGGHPWLVASGDFNADGNLDVAVTNEASDTVSILLGNGKGAFTVAPGSPIAVGANPFGLIVADLNGDQKLDIATANGGANSISVLLGDGMGHFTNAAGSPFSSGGAAPGAIGFADFNGDGKPDLVVANGNTNGANVALFIGNGTGAFTAQGTFPGGSFAYSNLVTGDFNKDGRQDLAIGDYDGNNVTVLLGAAPGSPSLKVTKTHAGNFSQGQHGATYTITASNIGTAATNGTILQIFDTLPAGLTATAASGAGWICATGATVGCNQGGALAPGANLPPITITVDIAATAPASVTNTVSLLGGGAGTVSASDPTTIAVVKIGSTSTATASSPVAWGQNITFNIQVAPPNGVAGPVPTGSVQIYDGDIGGTLLGTFNLTNGAVSPSVSTKAFALFPKAHSFSIYYSGDNQYGGSKTGASTTVTGTPQWSISKSHNGNFTQGQAGVVYLINVANIGTGPATGATLTETPPAGLTITSIAGPGQSWQCGTTNCTLSSDFAVDNIPSAAVQFVVHANVAANAAGTITNQASISGGGASNAPSASDPATITPTGSPSWYISKTHSGSFVQGQTGKTYSIAVANNGTAAVSGTVTVTDTVPSGLTLVSMSGTNWNCSGATCTRGDGLSAGASYPAITVTVNVDANAPGSLTNTAGVSGGGASAASATDPTTISAAGAAQWSITKTHPGNFAFGQNGAFYNVVVGNTGTAPSNGTLTVTENLPGSLTLVSMAGTGWSCGGATCTRSDSLQNGAKYPAIKVSVNVPANSPSSVTNSVTVSGAGAGTATATDATSVVVEVPPVGVIDTPANNTTGIAGAIGVTGWAVASTGMQTVGLWREPIGGEATAPNGLVFLVNAAVVPGSRPDVAALYPAFPGSNAGWGAQILTNQLPNSGNGTYKIHAIAVDNDLSVVELGKVTITADNAHSVLPFGTIDTPEQGGVASGTSFINFGWAVTPNAANVIPKDGSTITVYIDDKPVGHPVYNNFRSDIATLFPGLQNSGGAVGYFLIDTTKYANGLHTIQWVVTDSANNAQGMGSRFFLIQN